MSTTKIHNFQIFYFLPFLLEVYMIYIYIEFILFVKNVVLVVLTLALLCVNEKNECYNIPARIGFRK